MKKTKITLFASAVSILLCLSMLIGTTFAWFTDEVSSGCNKIVAGNLEVDLEILAKDGTWSSLKESKAPIFNYDKWEPGYTEVTILKVDNEGTLALKWKALFTSEANLSILADVIDVYVLVGATEYPDSRDLEALGYKKVGTVAEFVNSIEETTYGFLEAGQSATLGIALKMQESAGNEYKGLSLGGAFDISIFATQYAFESDSFDNQYDVDPEEPVLVSRSGMLQEGQDSMNVNLFHKGSKLLSVNVPEDALVDPTKPVTVKVDSIDPETTIVVDENTKAWAYDIEVTNLKKNLGDDQLVTVVLAAPKGLPAVRVYHKGEEIKDIVYDPVAGTVTFKTGSFSPYAVAYNEQEVKTLADLREAVGIANNTIKLGGNIIVDLSKESDDRSIDHVLKSGKSTYYNAVNIGAQNITIDLNGYSITLSCGEAYNSNSDVGALFFVAEGGSLQIKNSGSVETGFIKMENSVYAVWAPYKDYTVDIYGGTFIGDSYAGDPLHLADTDTTDDKMPNENSCRALIYAGTEGRINVRGGYFLYNNTPNDALDRNNGAFNAKDFCNEELITIHDGVMLINAAYRQDPMNTSTPGGSFDNYSIKLAEDHEIKQITLDTPIKIEGVGEYATWYQVQRTYYELIFKDNGGEELDTVKIPFTEGAVTVDAKDDTAFGKLTGDYAKYFDGWVNVAGEKVTSIPADNKNDVTLYPTMKERYTVRWVDEKGNIIDSAVATKNTSYSSLTAPDNPESEYDNMTFDHWEIREKSSNGKVTYTAISSSYKITKDVTLYPFYVYDSGAGKIGLTPHDSDGDGRPEYYTVEAVDGLNGKLTIPGNVNGVPVTVVTDLSSDFINTGIETVIIKDGVQEIGSSALAATTGLKNVTIPVSVNKIGATAFATQAGVIITKSITITYEGTLEEWQSITFETGSGWFGSKTYWYSGLSSCTLICLGDGDEATTEDNHTYKVGLNGVTGTYTEVK